MHQLFLARLVDHGGVSASNQALLLDILVQDTSSESVAVEILWVLQELIQVNTIVNLLEFGVFAAGYSSQGVVLLLHCVEPRYHSTIRLHSTNHMLEFPF